MKILEKLRLNRWYGIMLYLGVLLFGASLYTKVDFVQAKHLMGLSIGLILIGFGHIMAEKYLNEFTSGGILYRKVLIHNPITILLIIVGIGLVAFFGYEIFLHLI